MQQEQLPWRSFADAGNAGAGPIATAWNLTSTPKLYVLDHEGAIRNRWAGPPSAKVLDAAIQRLLSVAEQRR